MLLSISFGLTGFLLVYAVVGSAIAALVFGKPPIRVKAAQLNREADFCNDLALIRENTEEIALYRGEQQEFNQSWQRFGRVFDNFTRLIRRQLGLNLFQNHYGQVYLPAITLKTGLSLRIKNFSLMTHDGQQQLIQSLPLEAQLDQQLKREGITPISIGHCPSLKQYHQHLLTLFAGSG